MFPEIVDNVFNLALFVGYVTDELGLKLSKVNPVPDPGVSSLFIESNPFTLILYTLAFCPFGISITPCISSSGIYP